MEKKDESINSKHINTFQLFFADWQSIDLLGTDCQAQMNDFIPLGNKLSAELSIPSNF